MNIGEVVDVEEMNYQCCVRLSILNGFAQISDFYFAYYYYGFPNTIAFDITISFWFLVNGIIGFQYSMLLIIYQLIKNTYRSHFIFTFGLLLSLALAWSIIGYIGFFQRIISFYFMFKLVLQTIVYIFTIGSYLNN